MIAVIFEVVPAAGKKLEYLDLAAGLRPHLETIAGFLSIERFQSLSDPQKLLSLSFWDNEEAVAAWRRFEQHREAQERGRQEIFESYRLRIAGVVRDYGKNERHEAPADSRVHHG